MTSLTFNQYFSDPGLFSFFLSNLTLVDNIQSTLPKVFLSNPLPYAILDPIWTLPWELRSYLLLALGGVLFSIKKQPKNGLLLFFAVLCNAVFLMELSRPSLFIFLFMSGGALYLLKPRPLTLLVVFSLVMISTVSCYGGKMFELFFCSLLVILVYSIGFSEILFVKKVEEYDLSYGIYIYAFPLAQIIVSRFYIVDPWILLIINMAVTAVVAFISWNFVESLVLKRKAKIANLICNVLIKRKSTECI